MKNQINQRVGRYITEHIGGETVRSYVPNSLPPVPPLKLEPLQTLLEQSNQALGRLDGVASVLPDLTLFLYAYVRKEAVLSSQIEGTQSSLSDLLMHESQIAPGVPIEDVQEVSNYVAALTYGLNRIREGFPLSLRLICEIHEVLLSEGRGSGKTPGKFRTSQNWIGGTRPGNAEFVPPPPAYVLELMGDLETFCHRQQNDISPLVRAGLVHVQFETIHPFLDGNGRLGRLLITFLLCALGSIREPLLYLSLYFKTHRSEYYNLLTAVRETGDWERWLSFFLTGVRDTAEQAVESARNILTLIREDRQKVETIGRSAATALRVLHVAETKPILNVTGLAEKLGIAFPTASAAVTRLAELGILKELTGKERARVFVYDRYLALISAGTEPLRN